MKYNITIKTGLALSLSMLLCPPGYTDPWFTGPLFAPAGKTIPNGHTNVELYGMYIHNFSRFDNDWKKQPIIKSRSDQYNLIFSHGIADEVDVQFAFPYVHDVVNHLGYQGIGDMNAALGLQLLRQTEHSWIPNLRLSIVESIPTGRFEQLNPSLLGTDQTGAGSYQTSLNLNFQDLSQPVVNHYIRTRFSLGYTMPSVANVNGVNALGGNSDTTMGSIKEGDTFSLDLASEITVTQNWVAVLEGLWTMTKKGHFTGNPGFLPTGEPVTLADLLYNTQISFAPAIEYNFTERLGVIAGAWFIAAGKNTVDFRMASIAINAFW